MQKFALLYNDYSSVIFEALLNSHAANKAQGLLKPKKRLDGAVSMAFDCRPTGHWFKLDLG